MDRIIDEVLPVELKNNNVGRGSKWFPSAQIRRDIESLLRTLGHEREPFDTPVQVRVTRILGRRQSYYDPDSVGRGVAKELFDALVAVGWFRDDSWRWIRHVDYRQDASRRADGPATRIEVFEWEGEL